MIYYCVRFTMWSFVIHCPRVQKLDYCNFKSKFDIFLNNPLSKVGSTQAINLILFSLKYLFLIIALSLSFLNVVLKGLKQDICKSCNAREIQLWSVTKSNLNAHVCSIAFKVTWDPWLFRIKDLDLFPPSLVTILLKRLLNSLNKKIVIQFFFASPYRSLACISWCSHPIVSHLWRCRIVIELYMLQVLLHSS